MIRVLVALLALILGLAPVRGEVPVCTGRDLLAELKANDAAKYEKIMSEARSQPNGNALFWKIERGGSKPSFLLGTAHVTDTRVTAISPEAKAALDGAGAVVLELAELGDASAMAAAQMRNAAKLVLPPGQTVWDLVPDKEEHFIRDNVNMPPGVVSVYGYQPWLVAAMISVPLCEHRRQQGKIPFLDELLARSARDRGIPLAGLETVEEQISIMASLSLEDQAKYLVAVAKLGPAIPDHFETLMLLYQRREIAAYLPFMLAKESLTEDDQRIMTFVEEELLRKRNHRMAERAVAHLDRGNAFIAVGALHLPGKEGVVELLRQRGYKVTPVN